MLQLPRRWTWSVQAAFLYEVARQVPLVILGNGRQTVAKMQLNKLLRIHKLPPLAIPPVQLPHAARQELSTIKAGIREATRFQKCRAAAEWVHQHVRFTVAKPKVWASQFSANRILRAIDVCTFRAWSETSLADASQAPSLKATPGTWKLPMSRHFSPKALAKRLRRSWGDWCRVARLSGSAAGRGWASVCAGAAGFRETVFPEAWKNSRSRCFQ